MKKTILILSIVVLALASQAQHIYNNGARIVGTSGSYWVLDNGNFALTSASATNLAQFTNLIINSNSSLTLGTDATPAYLTVSGTLTNSSGMDGLVIPSGSSLIENSAAAATVKRAIPANQWHLISAPTSNAKAVMFEGKYLQKHTESTNAYTDIISVDEALAPMRGYAIWGDAGFTATYAGPLNAGEETYSISFAYPGALPLFNKGWNLVGNPYPSSIDWDASGWTKTNVNAATYCHVTGTTGAENDGWATYVAEVGTNGGSRYIAPGQGFFVKATAAGTLGMTNAVRVHNATSFFKNAEVVPNLIRLEVSGNGYKDEAVFRFLQEASAEFDGQYDAHKLFGDVPEAPQIYTLGSTELCINSMPETSVVPVGVKAGSSGTYVIAATEVNDMQFATLEDTQTGIFTDITQYPYSFSYTSGEAGNRFKLHFSALGTGETEAVAANIYSYRKTAYINLDEKVKGDIFIYNIAGQLVATKLSVQGTNEINLTVTGYYMVKVVTDKTPLVKKIFIQ